MTDHAIVIGIDAHRLPGQELRAAVGDAVSFAKWVIARGQHRASPETLTLLLSPRADAPSPDLPFQPATRKAIEAAFNRYSLGDDGKEAERLWIFYAGHGLSAPGDGPDAAPMMVPADVDNLRMYLQDQPLWLGGYLGALQLRPPRTQLVFIDACRRFVDSEFGLTASSQLRFDLRRLRNGAPGTANQAVLYATLAGQTASEQRGRGLFSQALLEGLEGKGPTLQDDEANSGLILTFDSLTRYIQRRVRGLVSKSEKDAKPLPAQAPSADTFNTTGELPLVRFASAPNAKLDVLVEPNEARRFAVAGIRVLDRLKRYQTHEVKERPLPNPLKWSVPYGIHLVQVQADDYPDWKEPVDLIEDMQVVADLANARKAPLAGSAGAAGQAPDPEPGKAGRLRVSSPDKHARIQVFDMTGARVKAGLGSIEIEDITVGAYRVETVLPGQDTIDQVVFVTDGEDRTYLVEPQNSAGEALDAALDALGLRASKGASEPSEVLGPSTPTFVGSVLAWAAWAARFPGSAGTTAQKLRAVGVDTLPQTSPTDAIVQVLVGDAKSPIGRGSFLDDLTVAVGPVGEEQAITMSPVAGLQGLAVQWAGQVPDGGTMLVFRGSRLRATSLPVPALPGYVSVIVVASELDGRIEIHRYLSPLLPADSPLMLSDLVRRVEQSFRSLDTRVPFLPDEAESLLADEALDPLATAVVGYRLAREGRVKLMAEPTSLGISPLARMEQKAPGLADRHVLAALVANASSGVDDDHLSHATNTGVPIVADGHGILSAWLVVRAMNMRFVPPYPVRPFGGGGPWTAFDARDQGFPTTDRAIPVTSVRPGSTPWSDRVLRVASATARLTVLRAFGTAVLLAPRVLATIDHLMVGFHKPHEGRPLPEHTVASFRASTPALEVQVRSILARSKRGAVLDSFFGERGPHHVYLLDLEDQSSRTPAEIAWSLPRVGQRIAVIGHPGNYDLPRVDTLAIGSAFRDLLSGESAIMLGKIVAVDPGNLSFEYEAWTTPGVSGGPVVDLETGHVIGVHAVAQYDSKRTVKRCSGVLFAALADDPMWEAAAP